MIVVSVMEDDEKDHNQEAEVVLGGWVMMRGRHSLNQCQVPVCVCVCMCACVRVCVYVSACCLVLCLCVYALRESVLHGLSVVVRFSLALCMAVCLSLCLTNTYTPHTDGSSLRSSFQNSSTNVFDRLYAPSHLHL